MTPENAPAVRPPRLRSADDIDLTRAKPSCRRCHGRGITGYRTVDNEIKVAIVCRCVTRNGGVKPDALDGILKQIEQQLADGTWGKVLASDIQKIPEPERTAAIARVQANYIDPETPENVRRALAVTLEQLGATEKAS
jgi:hypothetical protein